MRDMESVPLSDISPDPANVRKHSEQNISAIMASLRAFGQQTPIVVDNRGIILKGNGTYEAIAKLGWDTVKVVRTELSGSQATAYAIADNRTAELAEWDLPALSRQLSSLHDEGFDLDELSFGEDFLAFGDDDQQVDPEAHREAAGEIEGYDTRGIKQVILLFETEQYDLIVEALAAYCDNNALGSNSEAVVHLLEHNGFSVTPRL